MLVSSLRDVIRKQSEEIEALRLQLSQTANIPDRSKEVDDLKAQLAASATKLMKEDERRKEMEKEQEDLYVLLDEVNTKRKRDKALMRHAGLDVSEDEAEDDEDDDEDESDAD